MARYTPEAPQKPGPSGPTGIGSAPTSGMTSSQQNAWAILEQLLESYGFTGAALSQLVQWAKGQIIQGVGTAQFSLDLMQTPQFKQRFPAIGELAKLGVAITPAQYISMEQSYASIDQQAGLRPDFADFDRLIAAQVSPSEFAQRIQQGYVALATAPAGTIQEFERYNNVSPGDLVGYFLDPTKSAPLLMQKALAAQLGQAAETSSFGNVTATQAQRLAAMGVTYSQAQSGFQTLGKEAQLYENQPGQGQRYGFTSDNLLGAQFGSDAQTAEELAQQAAGMHAQFQAGQGVGQSGTLTGAGQYQR